MGSRYNRKRMNVEEDRLSNLSDDLIHKIFSFIGTKHAVKTSVLSSRWRYIWTSMLSLSFSTKDFYTVSKFSKFVTGVLSNRNSQIEVHSVELAFLGKASQRFVKKILNYAFSHNVQQLNITCLSGKNIEFPISLLASQSLKHLTLNGCSYGHFITTLFTWNLPALTTLNLYCVTLYDDSMTDKQSGLLSNCANLRNLTINKCIINALNGFSICHPGLSSLTLVEDGYKGVNVVTPQLMNLAINRWPRIHVISAPNLCSLHFDDDCRYGGNLLQLSTELLHLEKADICVRCPFKNEVFTRKIVCLIQQLRSVKVLTLNLELVKYLSSSVELILNQPSPFVNLKSLKIYPSDFTESKVTMSTEVKNYLLDGSPDATLTMVSHEEIRAVENIISARNRMGILHEVLDQWKTKCETNTGHIATVHEQVEVVDYKEQLATKTFGERMSHIKSYWKDLNGQLNKGYNNTLFTISLLLDIEEVLKKVPESHQAKLQARFFDLRAEAETIMYDVMNRLKIERDKMPSSFNVFFNEFATSSYPPS